jgi:flagellar protein FlaI
MFSAVDIVATQTSTTVDGRRVRRAKSLVEIDEYDAGLDEFVVDRTYDWDSVTDEIRPTTTDRTDLMEEVRRDNGWTAEEFRREWSRREALLSYLVREGIDTYAGVAATIQAYVHSPDLTMSLVSQDELAARIDDLTTMRTIDIDVDDEVEELVPRPSPDPSLLAEVESLLEDRSDLLAEYEDGETGAFRGDTPVAAGFDDTGQSGDDTNGDSPGSPDTPPGDGGEDRRGSVPGADGVTSERVPSAGTGEDGSTPGHDDVTRVPSPEPPASSEDGDTDEGGDRT